MKGKKDTILVVSENISPIIAVDNLEAMFDGSEDNTQTTTITLESKRVTETDVASDKEKIEAKLFDNYEVGMYLDLTLKKDTTEIQPPNGERISVAIILPEELLDKGNYMVLRVHNDIAEYIPSKVDITLNTLTFEADKFSTYALVSSQAATRYKLTITDAKGKIKATSIHLPGDIVNINASNIMPSGSTFKEWIPDDVTALGDKNSKIITYKMIDRDATIKCVYEEPVVEKNDEDKDNESSVVTAITTVTEKNDKPYMTGYSDGTFKPNGYLTRDEVAAIFARIDPRYDDYKKYKMTMPDPSQWAYNYIGFCLEDYIMKGYPDKTFKPKQYITKSEFTAVLVRSQKIDLESNSRFKDAKGRWFEGYVAAIEKIGVTGRIDGTYGADEYITRAEAAKLVNIACDRDITDEELKAYKNKFKDISETSWYYKDVINATR